MTEAAAEASPPDGRDASPLSGALEWILLVALVGLVLLILWGQLPSGSAWTTGAAQGGLTGAVSGDHHRPERVALDEDGQPGLGPRAASAIFAGLVIAGIFANLALLVGGAIGLPHLARFLGPRAPAAPRWGLVEFFAVMVAYLLLQQVAAAFTAGSTIAARLLGSAGVFVVAGAVAVLVVLGRHGRASLGLVVPTAAHDGDGARPADAAAEAGRGALGYVLGAPAFFAVFLGTYHLLVRLGVSPIRHPVERALTGPNASVAVLVAGVLVAVILAPIVEEILFRGMLIPALEQLVPTGVAVALSAAVFASFHVGLHAIPPIFVLGCLFGGLFVRRRTLLAPIAAHACHNLVTIVVALLKASG